MKLFKKLTAIAAMAAVCCALNVPMIASAGTYTADPGMECPHDMVNEGGEYLITTDTHHYIDDNGVQQICTITTTYIQYSKLRCSICGISRIDDFKKWVNTVHSGDCDQK